jgi:hypothetical protein
MGQVCHEKRSPESGDLVSIMQDYLTAGPVDRKAARGGQDRRYPRDLARSLYLLSRDTKTAWQLHLVTHIQRRRICPRDNIGQPNDHPCAGGIRSAASRGGLGTGDGRREAQNCRSDNRPNPWCHQETLRASNSWLVCKKRLKVAREGIEPPTRGFSVRCSTN